MTVPLAQKRCQCRKYSYAVEHGWAKYGSLAACKRSHGAASLVSPRHSWIKITWLLTDRPGSGVVYNFGRVCMSVCKTITVESLDGGSSLKLVSVIG